jgi:hypothetical protein
MRLLAVSLTVATVSACGGSFSAPADPAVAAIPPGANPAAFQAPVHGVITRQESEQRGVDGRPECEGGDARTFVSTLARPGTEPDLVDGYLTDEAGYLNWDAAVSGSRILGKYTAESFDFDSAWALCWFSGDFTANRQDVGLRPTEHSSVLVAANTMSGTTSVHVVSASDNVMAILAPAPPQRPAAGPGAGIRQPVQPNGVLVISDRPTPPG